MYPVSSVEAGSATEYKTLPNYFALFRKVTEERSSIQAGNNFQAVPLSSSFTKTERVAARLFAFNPESSEKTAATGDEQKYGFYISDKPEDAQRAKEEEQYLNLYLFLKESRQGDDASFEQKVNDGLALLGQVCLPEIQKEGLGQIAVYLAKVLDLSQSAVADQVAQIINHFPSDEERTLDLKQSLMQRFLLSFPSSVKLLEKSIENISGKSCFFNFLIGSMGTQIKKEEEYLNISMINGLNRCFRCLLGSKIITISR